MAERIQDSKMFSPLPYRNHTSVTLIVPTILLFRLFGRWPNLAVDGSHGFRSRRIGILLQLSLRRKLNWWTHSLINWQSNQMSIDLSRQYQDLKTFEFQLLSIQASACVMMKQAHSIWKRNLICNDLFQRKPFAIDEHILTGSAGRI